MPQQRQRINGEFPLVLQAAEIGPRPGEGLSLQVFEGHGHVRVVFPAAFGLQAKVFFQISFQAVPEAEEFVFSLHIYKNNPGRKTVEVVQAQWKRPFLRSKGLQGFSQLPHPAFRPVERRDQGQVRRRTQRTGAAKMFGGVLFEARHFRLYVLGGQEGNEKKRIR